MYADQYLFQRGPAQPVTPAPTTGQGTGNVTATSVGAGSPLGWQPVLTPDQTAQLMRGLSQITYSVPAGGYLFNTEAQNANSFYNKFGAGGGGQGEANALARSLYGMVGNAPTVPGMTAALQSLYQNTGLQPRQGPSLTSRLGTPYYGPFEFGGSGPGGYHPFEETRRLWGMNR
jgi:hypothetical protein